MAGGALSVVNGGLSVVGGAAGRIDAGGVAAALFPPPCSGTVAGAGCNGVKTGATELTAGMLTAAGADGIGMEPGMGAIAAGTTASSILSAVGTGRGLISAET